MGDLGYSPSINIALVTCAHVCTGHFSLQYQCILYNIGDPVRWMLTNEKTYSYHKVHHQLRTHILRDMLVMMKGTGKGCGSSRDVVIGCGQKDKVYQQRVWFL